MDDENSKTEYDRTLAEVIAEAGVLSVEQAAAVTLQLAEAVRDLHAEGKVHRQICADTVRVGREMSAKLETTEQEVTLGGIGVDLVPCPPPLQNMQPVSLPAAIDAAQQALTEAGILLNPQQIDFYQLGALLCFMTSGHNVSEYLRSCKAKARAPEVIRPVLDRALGLNSKDCFQSADSFISELEAIILGKPPAKSERSHLPDSIFAESLSKSEATLQSPRNARDAGGSLPFEKLGHYQIIERIGHGGMGDVYKGYEQALDRFVAIKVLPPEFGRQEDFVKRFHAEAAAIARLDHPNVVRIYYTGQDQGHHFFAMQYVDGQTLADLLEHRKRLTPSEALPIIEQCLAGIGAAHRSGLIHRDIKPGNVLLDRSSRRALVTDFGVVKAIQAQTQITVTGTVMGTADYIAPEQARGQDIDARADLYAMGVLIYQMLSGRLPFQAESATSMMFQHAYEPPPPLAEVAPDVPGPLADIVMKLMAKKPEERYQSADELLADLHTIRLMPAAAGYKPQTNIVKAPEYDATPQLPVDLVRFVPTGWLSRLRNRVVDLFGAHAPQVVQRMQTTGQQVDGTIAEYERQREQLAKLAEEAKSLAADLERQANSHANAAQMAAQRAEATPRTTAKHTALKQQQESEQAAAELAQLAAEQQQQCEDIEMRLTKLNTILVQLRSQRNVLNARLNAARAHLKAGGARPSQWRPSKRLVYVPITLLLACIIAAMTYVLWPAAEAEEGLIAHWKFDEGGGYTAYDSVGNNHGTIHGAKWVTGEFGTALSFNGVDDYVDTTDFTLPESFSISLWINTSSNRDDQCFIAKNHPGGRGGDNIFIFGFYEGEFHVRIRNSAHLEGTITEGWQCLTAVAEQLDSEHTNITLYRQGKVLWTKIFDDVVGNMSGKPWTIGQEWDGFRRTDFFKGKIDDVK
ncbi:MAG: protein kinase domain-containing protein, partial [Planctomycetota bacterium]